MLIQRVYQNEVIHAYPCKSDDFQVARWQAHLDSRAFDRGWDEVRIIDDAGKVLYRLTCPFHETSKRKMQRWVKNFKRFFFGEVG